MLKALNTRASATFLGVSPRTLEKWRVTGGGPPYRKLGARVVYVEDDLVEWVDARRRCSTSDPQRSKDKSPLGRSNR